MSVVRFARCVATALWRDRKPYQRLAAIQQRKLRRLVAHAQRRVPFYAEKYRGIDPRNFSLQDLPPVGSAEMMANFCETITDAAVGWEEVVAAADGRTGESCMVQDRFLVSQTSGSTGPPGYFLNDQDSWDVQRGGVFARTFRDRLPKLRAKRFSKGRKYRMAFLVSDCGTCVAAHAAFDALKRAGRFVEVQLFPARIPVSEHIAAINDFQPDYLHSYSVFLEQLARRKLAGDATFSPRFISAGSEKFTAGARAVVSEAFPEAQLTEQYGSTECVVLGNECLHGRMHLNMDYSILEPVDESNRPVPVGETSHHVLLTNLVNPVQPIIRYHLSDALRLTGERCPCGRSLPVGEIQGRTDDAIWLRDQRGDWKLQRPIPLQLAMYRCKGVGPWQLSHRSQNLFEIHYVLQPGYESQPVANDIRREIRRALAEDQLEDDVRIEISEVPEVQRSNISQKTRQIKSEVAPPSRPELMNAV